MITSKKGNMNLRRKLVGLICLIILFGTIYFMFYGERSKSILLGKEKILTSIHNLNVSSSQRKKLINKVHSYVHSKDVRVLKGYVVDEMMFGNIKEIEKITEAELNELAKLGIKREKSDFVLQRKKKKKRKKKKGKVKLKTVDVITSTSNEINEISNNKVKHTNNNVRMKYKFRNPREKDISKLSQEQYNIELATDPLPSSIVCNGQHFLTVLVETAPSNFLRRQFIRDTWGNSYVDDVSLLKKLKPMRDNEKSIPLKNMFKTVFVLGKTRQGNHMKEVYDEARLNKDIVFGSLIEDYKNLTMKTRLGLKWTFYDCDSIYLVKTDDDVFMNPVMIVEWLKDMPRYNLYTGWCNFNSPVVRNPNNKWYVSPEDYGPSTYPGYCLGGGYLMSNDVLGKVINMSYGRNLFPMEDLYVGLMINEMKEVKIRDHKDHFDLVYSGRSNDCELNNLFLAHQVYGQSLVSHIKRARNAMSSCD